METENIKQGDNWCLKDKFIPEEGCAGYYNIKDIKTLKEKILEDLQKEWQKEHPIYPYTWQKILNKRFGE